MSLFYLWKDSFAGYGSCWQGLISLLSGHPSLTSGLRCSDGGQFLCSLTDLWPLTFPSLTSGLHCSDGDQLSRPWWLYRDAVFLLLLLPGSLTLDNSSLCSLRFPQVCSTWSACWVSLVKVQTSVLNLNRLKAVVPADGFPCSWFLSSNTSVKAHAAASHRV